MENKDVNEANPNILRTSPVDLDSDQNQQESNNQSLLHESKPIDLTDNLLVSGEFKPTVNHIFGQHENDEGKKSVVSF